MKLLIPVTKASTSKAHLTSALLIAFRAFLAPVLLFDAIDGHASTWFVWVFLCGLFSDVIDGEILRVFRASTSTLRRLDSNADAAFYMSVLLSLWFVRPQIIRFHLGLILALLVTQLSSWVFCLVKFRKLTSYHSYLAKLWALTLCAAIISILTEPLEPLIIIAIIVGFLSHFEDVLITAVLPQWQVDVVSVAEAFRLRHSPSMVEMPGYTDER